MRIFAIFSDRLYKINNSPKSLLHMYFYCGSSAIYNLPALWSNAHKLYYTTIQRVQTVNTQNILFTSFAWQRRCVALLEYRTDKSRPLSFRVRCAWISSSFGTSGDSLPFTFAIIMQTRSSSSKVKPHTRTFAVKLRSVCECAGVRTSLYADASSSSLYNITTTHANFYSHNEHTQP